MIAGTLARGFDERRTVERYLVDRPGAMVSLIRLYRPSHCREFIELHIGLEVRDSSDK
ncbi:MAG TPA: hypothetical protein VF469_36035 [Kofleriaceae bacterium]